MAFSLPPEIEQFVENEIAAGSYSSREELIATAITLLKQHQGDLSRLRSDIALGLEGQGIVAEEVFDQLRSQFIRPVGLEDDK